MDDVSAATWVIGLSVGALMVIFGCSQLVKPGPWLRFVPKWVQKLVPVPAELFMRFHALGNIALGLWLISGLRPAWAAAAAGLWLLSIVPFAMQQDFYVGLRDAVILAALTALFLLAQ